MSDAILLYRYMPPEGGIKSIESKKFRVGRLKELNDPFDFFPGLNDGFQNPFMDEIFLEKLLDKNHDDVGVLCFSEDPSNPLMWSHYAEHHRGLLFEIEMPKSQVTKVKYRFKRPLLEWEVLQDRTRHEEMKNFMNLMRHTKYRSWRYEKEWRHTLNLKECEVANGMFLKEIHRNSIRRVILGIRCQFSDLYVRKALDTSGYEHVLVSRAKRDLISYQVIC